MTSALLLLLLSAPQPKDLEARLASIEAQAKGSLGAAVVTPMSATYLRRNERFSLQSVMKLIVSMAVLDQVDQGKMKLDGTLTFRRSDLSVFHQPIRERLGKKQQISVKVSDCIELTVTQSCSASGDFLIRKMGGVKVVNAFLRKRGISGLSVDRQERDLQTQIGGVAWRPEYVDEAKLEAAFARVSDAKRDAAYRRYQADPRDTTTPFAMASLLKKLVTGKLLSPRSTTYLMGVMERTSTGADRLRAGVPAGWIQVTKRGQVVRTGVSLAQQTM